jgi:hypothetical protein
MQGNDKKKSAMTMGTMTQAAFGMSFASVQ